MNTSHTSVFTVLLLIQVILVLPQQTFAQDGSFVEQIKERRAQREQASAAKANAEAESKIAQPGDHTFAVTHDGLSRKYLVHVPATYDAATPTPLLVALHGGGGDMNYQASDERYGLISKSEQAGFIAVFPNGYSRWKSGKFATWNAGGCCGDARDKDVDDVGFIKEIVDKVAGLLNVDRNRIFATGMSNGGMMSYRLACELSDTFSGIAAVAGTDGTKTCNPKRPISILHIHARNDDHVLFDGGAGDKAFRDESKIMDFPSVPATVSKWVKANGCHPTPKRVLEKPGAYCELYSQCQGNSRVQLCVTDTGGHSWPGGFKVRSKEPSSQAISANDVMWQFFASE